MAEVKLTKNELRNQQKTLSQLEKYLPTLQLKKAMLQSEIYEARQEIAQFTKEFTDRQEKAVSVSSLFTANTPLDLEECVKIEAIHRRFENIAGIEVPYFDSVEFEPQNYTLFDTPPWIDSFIEVLQSMKGAQVRVWIGEEKRAALERALRQVSILVNLFEKFLIPRALKNIKKIRVFLGDQELAAVSQAKAAKKIIEKNKEKKKKISCASM